MDDALAVYVRESISDVQHPEPHCLFIDDSRSSRIVAKLRESPALYVVLDDVYVSLVFKRLYHADYIRVVKVSQHPDLGVDIHAFVLRAGFIDDLESVFLLPKVSALDQEYHPHAAFAEPIEHSVAMPENAFSPIN